MTGVDIESVEREIVALEPHDFHGGVARPLIEAQAAIGLRFPPGYVQFLERLGSGYVSLQEFIGLGGPPHLDVVKETLHLREHARVSRVPHSLIPVLADGGGNYECIDTSRPTSGGEYKVVSWLHDGGHGQDCEEIASSHLEWVWSTLQTRCASATRRTARRPSWNA